MQIPSGSTLGYVNFEVLNSRSLRDLLGPSFQQSYRQEESCCLDLDRNCSNSKMQSPAVFFFNDQYRRRGLKKLDGLNREEGDKLSTSWLEQKYTGNWRRARITNGEEMGYNTLAKRINHRRKKLPLNFQRRGPLQGKERGERCAQTEEKPSFTRDVRTGFVEDNLFMRVTGSVERSVNSSFLNFESAIRRWVSYSWF